MRYVKGKPHGCKICHREKERERPYNADRHRAYAAAHRSKINARYYLWRAVNRPSRSDIRRGGPGAMEYARLIINDPCSYCGAPATEIDHIVAVANGGVSNWENLAAACRQCNTRKRTQDLLQFMLRELNRAA